MGQTGPDVRVLTSVEEVAREGALWIADAIRGALAAHASASVCLAGGGTPRRAYELLGAEALAWERVDFYFGDERCVDPDDPESNFRMAREALIRPGGPRLERVHRIHAELPDRDVAAAQYEAALPRELDAMVLGIGEDGHTASLFPGSAALAETARRVLPVKGAKPPPWRLTVTPPVLREARRLLVLGAGAGKADAVANALAGGDFLEVPARLAARAGATWLLDVSAASKRG
jgi:6-phosphogluconolactonase